MEMAVISIHDDPKVAPRYDPKETKELKITKFVITEKGTVSDLPIVDVQLEDADGNKYFAMTTGRIFQLLNSAVQGVNYKNHGNTNP